MKIILKILLLPVRLLLTILVAICRVLCHVATVLLALLAIVVFLIGVGTALMLQEVSEGFKIMGLAFLISPFGVPLIATFLVEVLGSVNDMLKAI